jgi:voltage-gated potassium channel Kch
VRRATLRRPDPGRVEHPALGPSPWLVVAGVLMAVGLIAGFAGLRELGSDDWPDDLYAAIRLLLLDLDLPPGTEPNELLEIGRWAAPAGAALATYRGLLRVFASERERWRAHRRRDHVVVVGLGDYGSHLARAFRRDGREVTGIELDPGAASVAGLRAAGGLVVTGDAGDPGQRLLEAARADRARYLVVTCGDDGLNVEIAMRAGALIGERERPLTAFVHLDDLRLWPQLKARAVSARGARPYRIEFFNVFESAARMLLDAHPPGDRVVIAGFGEMGEQVLLHVAQRRPGVQVTVIDANAGERVARLADRHPRLEEVADVDAVDAEIDRAPEDLLEGIVYVCAERDTDGVAAALALHPAARVRGVPIVVVIDDEERRLAGALGTDAGVSVFGVVSRALPPGLLVRGTNEVLARAKHEHYLEMERAKGVDELANPSATEWDRLPESLKESNRAFADRIGEKLEAIDCLLVPDPLATGTFAFEPEEIESLAQLEHERWRKDLDRDHWVWGEVKDPERKRHPLLVGWDELPEEEREKDREPVRVLPAFVARAGFRIVRVHDLDRSPRKETV